MMVRRFTSAVGLAAALLLASPASASSLDEAVVIASDPALLATRATEAERLFLKAAQEAPSDVRPWYDLGLMREHLGDHKGAAEAWQRALQIDPKHQATRAQLAALDLAAGRTDTAVQALEAIITENRFQPEARNALAGWALSKNDYESALKHSRNVLLGDPRNVDAALNAAIAYYRQGLYDQAGLIATSFLEKVPNAAALHNMLGLVFLQRDNTRKATEHFLEALKLDPSHGDARLNLAALELGFGNFESAYRRFSEALEEDPTNAELVLSKAVAARGLERYDEAAKGYEQALSLRPNYPEAQYNLCVLHQQFTQQWKPALSACEAYLATLDPKHPKYRELKKRVKSIETTLKVLELQEKKPEPGAAP